MSASGIVSATTRLDNLEAKVQQVEAKLDALIAHFSLDVRKLGIAADHVSNASGSQVTASTATASTQSLNPSAVNLSTPAGGAAPGAAEALSARKLSFWPRPGQSRRRC